jgi:hypothetical protein
MRKYLLLLFALGLILSGCEPANEFQGKNPKTADVRIEGDQVIITIPMTTPYFRLEKVQDDTTPYHEISFRYASDEGRYYFRTDLEEWRVVPSNQSVLEAGQVRIQMEADDITITYPSGTWAFP